MNIDVLTQSHSAIAAKKRARHAQIKQIVFDEEARRSFLTGFHKRKVARREQAKKKAQLREKQERLETRREHRRALAERAARNAAEVEKAYGAHADSDGDQWGGIANEEAMEEEYEGEEQLATVTVVQDFDLAGLSDGPLRRGGPAREGKEKTQATVARTRGRTSTVKYETKAARRAEQRKQRVRRTEKAERAGRRRK
ncbi:nucleolar protein 12-domain-containing protein [Chiua virens]|nr:nucleolar protein 12-domain-containing protein [Chiua virens]